ncbi:ubiquinol-cytochrome C reductase complex core protein 2 precursor [Mucor ambiguus]|uniref:Cytochrome b-c1 complex subunit 2, mitochondrial n=1 Tax=Mucor ambiguus TaxID=91626 RepID=A0A0C9MXB6_9FUNG|nr:ubiquinol-cytochrome C reductase complex core protein 2 precursor [Mucor ambiguus]
MLAASRKAIISTASKATYATAATASQITTAANGVKVASSQEPGQTASLAVVVNGGARAESGSNAGVAHFLKNYGFKNNADRTAFRIAREAEIAGGVLSSNLSHESLVFSAELLKDDVELFAEILSDVVTKQKFQEHEFIDVAHQTAAESINALGNAEISAIEAAHHVAFRTGLGNSIFAKRTARVNNATVKSFAQSLFTSGNVALVGTGVDHEILQNLAETYLNLPSGKLSLEATKYFGGETRIESVSNKGNYVLAFEGAALNSSEYAALQVLRQALGGEVNIKHTAGSGILAQTAAKFAEGTEIKAFNLGYSDAGLFGVQVSASTAETGAAIAAAVEQLKAVAKGLSSDDFSRAVAQAKYAATAGFETRLDTLETLGAQALNSGKYTSATDAVSAFEKVTTSDVAQIAEKLFKSKPTSVALGDLTTLPYADSVSL